MGKKSQRRAFFNQHARFVNCSTAPQFCRATARSRPLPAPQGLTQGTPALLRRLVEAVLTVA